MSGQYSGPSTDDATPCKRSSIIAAVCASSHVTHTSSHANLTVVPSLVDKVTADDIELAKRHGVDLSFVTLKDNE